MPSESFCVGAESMAVGEEYLAIVQSVMCAPVGVGVAELPADTTVGNDLSARTASVSSEASARRNRECMCRHHEMTDLPTCSTSRQMDPSPRAPLPIIGGTENTSDGGADDRRGAGREVAAPCQDLR